MVHNIPSFGRKQLLFPAVEANSVFPWWKTSYVRLVLLADCGALGATGEHGGNMLRLLRNITVLQKAALQCELPPGRWTRAGPTTVKGATWICMIGLGSPLLMNTEALYMSADHVCFCRWLTFSVPFLTDISALLRVFAIAFHIKIQFFVIFSISSQCYGQLHWVPVSVVRRNHLLLFNSHLNLYSYVVLPSQDLKFMYIFDCMLKMPIDLILIYGEN